jgi:hypothetical protein
MQVLRLVLLFSALIASPAYAQGTSAPKTLLGNWVFTQDGEGSSTCTLELRSSRVIGGFALAAPDRCTRVIQEAGELYAWYLNADGQLVLADAARSSLLVMRKNPDGGWSSVEEGGVPYLLNRPTRPRTAQEAMAGRWNIAAVGGAPLCQLALTSDAKGSSGKVERAGACSTAWLDRGWASWRKRGDGLEILDARGRVAFAFRQADIVTFEGKVAGNQIVFLTRP